MTDFTQESELRENLHRTLDALKALIARLPEGAEKQGLEKEMAQLSLDLVAYSRYHRQQKSFHSI